MSALTDLDLPLMANAEALRVRHYLLRLDVDPADEASLRGRAILVVQDLRENRDTEKWNVANPSLAPEKARQGTKAGFKCILDCCDLEIQDVFEVATAEDPCMKVYFEAPEVKRDREAFDKLFRLPPKRTLSFSTTSWSLQISPPSESERFPSAIAISYAVARSGSRSLWHRRDQAGSSCCFTPASPVNNRGLFPCQEPPEAMATWQAEIGAPEAFSVFCSGDEEARVMPYEGKSGWKRHYFYSQTVLPMSTFAVAVGMWESVVLISREEALEKRLSSKESRSSDLSACNHEPYPCHAKQADRGPLLPTRLIGPKRLVESVVDPWTLYVPACLEAARELLGPHPFPRLDIVILPRCFSGLGLASPNVIFISQSVCVNCDCSMIIRLAHEISHSWFGLVIGALDWTEEWLSEGFATFVEDPIHHRALQILSRDHPEMTTFLGCPLDGAANNKQFWRDLSTVRSAVRHRVLVAEAESSSPTSVLRPNAMMLGAETRDTDSGVLFVRNGRNPELATSQVHYVKGHFLLK